MKELLSIKEKAHRYDKALRVVEKLHSSWKETQNRAADEIEEAFPELGESEDDRIRKEIIQFLQLPHPQFVGKRNHEEWIAWLEKQGSNLVENGYTNNKDVIKYADNYSHAIWHKLMDNFKNIKDYYIGCNDVSDIVLNAIIDAYNWLEKQGEQNLINNADDEAEKYAKTLYCSNLEAVNDIGNCSTCENVKTAFKAGLEKQGEIKRSDYPYVPGWRENRPDNKPKIKHSILMLTIHGVAEGEWLGEEWCQYRWSCKIKDTEVLYWLHLSDLETLEKENVKQGEQKPTDKVESKFDEDEKIGEDIIAYMRYERKSTEEEIENRFIPWLEKRKTTEEALQYLKENHSPSEVSDFQAAMNIAVAKAYNKGYTDGLEKQEEQKSADKFEPKFNVGDWLVCCNYEPEQIIGIRNDMYEMSNGDIRPIKMINKNHNIRLWTIQDAKDGDVLTTDTWTFIFKKYQDKSVYYHCATSAFNNFSISDTGEFDSNCVHPATKEQRDLLFSKMKEAGYEWDAEKKEVMEIEQKPADTPKFKVGDWCIDDEDNTVFQIVKILPNTYTYRTNLGETYTSTHYLLEDDARLWTIQDAEDGDVLANKYGAIFINAGSSNERGTVDCYCYLSVQNEFFIEDHKAGSWFYKETLKPATKEQRDLLFTKMKEAGYEWDAEKKEVRKIEQKPKFCHHEVDLSDCSEEYRKAYYDGWNNCNQQHAQLEAEQKPTWSEEDERERERVVGLLEGWLSTFKETYYAKDCKRGIGWLKSLKDRVQPQPKQEWSEEDEEKLKAVCTYIQDYPRLSKITDIKRFNEYAEWLKSLKEKVQPQPKWSEEDEEHLNSIIESYKYLLRDYKACHNVDYIPYDSDTLIRNVVDDVNFLKSLKDMVHSQSKWSEEDDIEISVLINALGEFETYGGDFSKQKNWLKSLKDRVQPQDKQEWSEEDEERLDSIIAALEGCVVRLSNICNLETEDVIAQLNDDITYFKSLKEKMKGE